MHFVAVVYSDDGYTYVLLDKYYMNLHIDYYNLNASKGVEGSAQLISSKWRMIGSKVLAAFVISYNNIPSTIFFTEVNHIECEYIVLTIIPIILSALHSS